MNTLLLLEVVSSFDTAGAAVRFIAAANLDPEQVPKWTKEPITLPLGRLSPQTRALVKKGYYHIPTVRTFNARLKTHGECVAFAKNWILAIAEHGADEYFAGNDPALEANVSRSIGLKHGATPLATMVSKIYSNRNNPEDISCYMTDDGQCFVRGQRDWEPIELNALLAKLSQSMLSILRCAYGSAMLQVNTDAQQLATLYGSALSAICSQQNIALNDCVNLRKAVCEKFDNLRVGRMAQFSHGNGAQIEEIKEILRRNATMLTNQFHVPIVRAP